MLVLLNLTDEDVDLLKSEYLEDYLKTKLILEASEELYKVHLKVAVEGYYEWLGIDFEKELEKALCEPTKSERIVRLNSSFPDIRFSENGIKGLKHTPFEGRSLIAFGNEFNYDTIREVMIFFCGLAIVRGDPNELFYMLLADSDVSEPFQKLLKFIENSNILNKDFIPTKNY